jgi:hypothetical protein
MHVAPPLAVRSVVDVCAFVDDLPADAAGELLFDGTDDAPGGAVFVENGRVCWAAARGLAQRLSDLLAASAKLDPRAMDALYVACKRTRAPLGEYLVSAGVVSAPDLRAALLKHTAESLHALCAEGVSAAWIERRRGGYSSRFTFKTTELLSRTFAEENGGLAAGACAELGDVFGDRGSRAGEWGAAFVRSPARASPDPIAVYGAFPEKIEALLRLGRWASSSLDVTAPLHHDHTFVATVLDDGALVAWRSGAAILAGWTGVYGPARLLNRRARARRKDSDHGGL